MRMQPNFSLPACLLTGFSVLFAPIAAGADRTISDVELSNSGTLRGRVIYANGAAMPQANVQVRYQGKTIAVASSAANGQFAIEQVRGGLHEVVVAGQATPVRFWNCGTAPIGCPPEFCCEASVMQATPVATIDGCHIQQPCVPTQLCTPPVHGAFGMVDVITLTSLGTSIAALVVAIDANRSASNSLVSGSGTGTIGSQGTGSQSTGDVSSP